MKILLFMSLLFFNLYAKKDFYYSFINSSGQQISEQKKHEILDGFEMIEYVNKLAKDGRIDDAYSKIVDFKNKNELPVLESDIILTYSEISLKKGLKRYIIQAVSELENAINSSKIRETDLPQAYMTLVELKLATNKIKDAKYFAKIIVENFNNKQTNAYGNIFLAKVYNYTGEYRRSTKILYDILTKTKDIHVATMVADELFDVYIASKKRDKAYDLISKVLTNNIDFYANDSYLAIKKVNKLVKAGMPEFAVEILLELLQRAKKDDAIEEFKYKLADVYMKMYDGTNYYLYKAKELYKDILSDYPDGYYSKKSKMYIDEILMREGQISPSVIASKYLNSESMQQKALLQELFNDKKAKKYEYILRGKKVYKNISNRIAKRFGYDSMNTIFDEVNILLIKQYLAEGKCSELNKALRTSRRKTLIKLIQDKNTKYDFFECLVEVPYERGYTLVKDTFNNSRDANIYLYLERMALALDLIDDAVGYSAKVEMVQDKKILEKEFMTRFLLVNKKNNKVASEKFFYYASNHNEYIEANKNNPLIIDFYFQYYLSLIKNNDEQKAKKILMNLYKKQIEFNAPVYSPFVELELAKNEKEKNDYKKALDILNEAYSHMKRYKPNDKAKVYYELIRVNDMLNNEALKDEYISKCKSLVNTKDSLYKKMCDEL